MIFLNRLADLLDIELLELKNRQPSTPARALLVSWLEENAQHRRKKIICRDYKTGLCKRSVKPRKICN